MKQWEIICIFVLVYGTGFLFYLDHGRRNVLWGFVWPIAIWLDHKRCDHCGQRDKSVRPRVPLGTIPPYCTRAKYYDKCFSRGL